MATGLFLSETSLPCSVSLDRFVQINLTAHTLALPDQIRVDGVRLLSCWVHKFGLAMCCDRVFTNNSLTAHWPASTTLLS